MKLLVWLVAVCGVMGLPTRAATYDFVIRHGRVADGTGRPMFTADVAVKDGRIAAVGEISGDATREIEARERVIAPGFIDVHTHAENIEEQPLAENFLRMGVTTLVLGNCGSSKLNIAEFFRALETQTISPNVATLIGHNAIRSRAMGGSFMRPPSAAELAQMQSLVEQAMQDGAVGFSTGLIYLPGTFAKTEEIIELAKLAAAHGGIYASHIRNEGEHIFTALDEVFRIAREANIRAEISHIKLASKAAWGQTAQVLDAIEHARASGLKITQDQYVYTASSTSIGTLIPDEFRAGGEAAFRANVADAEKKAKLIVAMKGDLWRRGQTNFAYAVIASHRADTSLNGLNLVEAAQQRRGASTVEDQIEMILDLELHGGASGVFHGMSELDLRNFLSHTNTMIASDSAVRKLGEGVPHPRGYGSNARILARYVRAEKILTLEDAIRRMTTLPAETFHLTERGVIRVGAWADLVIFDPAKVQDHATFNDPHHFATGFQSVFVNGVEVVKDDAHSGARPGRVLRHEATRGKSF